MLFFQDNIAATMIAGVILLMVVVMQSEMQQASVDQTVVSMTKNQAIDFGAWIRNDLINVGAGVDVDDTFIESYSVDPETDNTSVFSFQRKINDADATPTRVTYQLVKADTVEVDGEKVTLYQVQRCQGAATCPKGSLNVTGMSPGTVSYFRIELLDEDGAAWTSGTSNAHYLRVRFAMASPLTQKNQYLHEAHWGTVLPIRSTDS